MFSQTEKPGWEVICNEFTTIISPQVVFRFAAVISSSLQKLSYWVHWGLIWFQDIEIWDCRVSPFEGVEYLITSLMETWYEDIKIFIIWSSKTINTFDKFSEWQPKQNILLNRFIWMKFYPSEFRSNSMFNHLGLIELLDNDQQNEDLTR
jgi:hypothetical protein